MNARYFPDGDGGAPVWREPPDDSYGDYGRNTEPWANPDIQLINGRYHVIRYRIDERRLTDGLHKEYTLRLEDGRQVHAQISPYSDTEARERVAAFVSPPRMPKARPYNWGRSMSKPGPKPKGHVPVESEDEA